MYIALTSILSGWEKQEKRRVAAELSLEDKGRLFDAELDHGWAFRIPGLLPFVMLLPIIAITFGALRPYWTYCFDVSVGAMLVLLALNSRVAYQRLERLALPEAVLRLKKRMMIVSWSLTAVFMFWLMIDQTITHK